MLHAGEGVFHAGPHASVTGVVRFLAGQERSAGSFPVRDDEAGVRVGAVGDQQIDTRHRFLYLIKAPGSGCARAPAFGPLGAAANAPPGWIGL